jgi:hypothetical protein
MISKNRNGRGSGGIRRAGGKPGQGIAQPGQGSVAGGVRIRSSHGKESLSKEQNKNKWYVKPSRIFTRDTAGIRAVAA